MADRTLMQKFNTEEFLNVQNKLTDALMKHKTAQREALSIIYDALEIPTRSEIDEAYRDIHALKREVRALRKALKEATAKTVQARHGKKTKEIEAPQVATS
jgi:polyhydroxyalkanoate synthesis regulator phasin